MKYRLIRLPFFDIQFGSPSFSFDGPCGIHCGRGSHQIGGSRALGNDRYRLVEDPGIHCGKTCCHGRRPTHETKREKKRRSWWQ